MSLKIIRKAFETRLATWAATVPINVAYENASFTQTNTAYVETFTLPGQTTAQYMAQNDRSYIGIVQINIHVPHNIGTSVAHNYAQSIAALYNLYIVEDLLRIYTQPAYELPAQKTDTHYILPLRIPYQCEVA